MQAVENAVLQPKLLRFFAVNFTKCGVVTVFHTMYAAVPRTNAVLHPNEISPRIAATSTRRKHIRVGVVPRRFLIVWIRPKIKSTSTFKLKTHLTPSVDSPLSRGACGHLSIAGGISR